MINKKFLYQVEIFYCDNYLKFKNLSQKQKVIFT
jgi:hypothetical protein